MSKFTGVFTLTAWLLDTCQLYADQYLVFLDADTCGLLSPFNSIFRTVNLELAFFLPSGQFTLCLNSNVF